MRDGLDGGIHSKKKQKERSRPNPLLRLSVITSVALGPMDAPFVLMCGSCRRVVSDSNQLLCAVADLDALVFDAVVGVSIGADPVTDPAGNVSVKLSCGACQAVLGNVYRKATAALEHIVYHHSAPRYALDRAALGRCVPASPHPPGGACPRLCARRRAQLRAWVRQGSARPRPRAERRYRRRRERGCVERGGGRRGCPYDGRHGWRRRRCGGAPRRVPPCGLVALVLVAWCLPPACSPPAALAIERCAPPLCASGSRAAGAADARGLRPRPPPAGPRAAATAERRRFGRRCSELPQARPIA